MQVPERKVALVTGGATRLGAEISRTLKGAGFFVAVHHNTSNPKELCRELGDCAAFRADFSNPQEAGGLIHRVVEGLGRLDVLVNNASVFLKTPIEQWDEELVRRMAEVNLFAPLRISLEALKVMKSQGEGRIINICDLLVEQPPRNYLAYVTIRASMWGLTRALAIEGAPYRIASNCIVLGTVLFGEQDKGLEEAIISRIPAGYVPGPQPVTSLVTYLSSAPTYITGGILRVDGGRSLV